MVFSYFCNFYILIKISVLPFKSLTVHDLSRDNRNHCGFHLTYSLNVVSSFDFTILSLCRRSRLSTSKRFLSLVKARKPFRFFFLINLFFTFFLSKESHQILHDRQVRRSRSDVGAGSVAFTARWFRLICSKRSRHSMAPSICAATA